MDKKEKLPRYFFNVEMFDVANFIVGFDSFPTDFRFASLEAVGSLAENQRNLDIPRPDEIFDDFCNVGIVPWEDHREIIRTSAYYHWHNLVGIYVRVDYTPNIPTSNPGAAVQSDFSLHRPEQLGLAA